MRFLSSLQKWYHFWFWLAVLGGNFLLFVPMYALTARYSAVFPALDGKAWLTRNNYDIWRISLEWFLVIAAGVVFPSLRRRRGYRWLAFALLVLLLVYQIYEAVDVAVYNFTPNFYNDSTFLLGGVKFLIDSLPVPWWVYPAAAVGLVLVLALLYGVVSTPLVWVPPERLGRVSRWGVVMLAAVALVGVVAFPAQAARPEGEVSSLVLKIAANLRRSRATREQVLAMQQVSPYRVYGYQGYALEHKPNIYLFFLESYGSVLVTNSAFRAEYQELMGAVAEDLEQAGWSMATGLSRSPVWGGGSWMAYTSMLCGVYLAQQPQYLALKYGFQRTPYPSFGRWLQGQGYRFTWVVPIHRELDPAIWASNRRFYGPDVWLTFEDLGYRGQEYSWGPSPPDQYTLGFLREWLRNQPPKPNLVLFLTQNTHYPFSPIPPLVDDWQALNDPSLGPAPDQSRPYSRKAYMDAVKYDWEVLRRFIRSAGPDDVFILIGDHQPPSVSGRWDGYTTIVHVLARDADFVAGFTAYGLQPGMWPDLETAPLRHEGLYSLLVRQLVARWGVQPEVLPAYHPQGILIPGILPKVRSIYRKGEKFKPREAP